MRAIFAAFFLLSSFQAVKADTIKLTSNEWCPFVCDPAGGYEGYMVEIVREALSLHGHSVEVELMAWQRGIQFAREGRLHGVIGTDEWETPDLLLSGPVAIYREVAAFRPGEGVPYAELETRNDLRVGGAHGYDYSYPVDNYIQRNAADEDLIQLLKTENYLEQNLRKLLANRIDMVPEERSVMQYNLHQLGLEDAVELTMDEESFGLSVGFNPDHEHASTYAEHLEQGIAQLRESGRLAEILTRYGIED